MDAMSGVLARGQLVLGPEVAAFEDNFAAYIGVGHCVGVASGTEAITLALDALGVRSGDEVISVALTSAGTAAGISAMGARIRYIDVEPTTRGMDPALLTRAIGPKTRAIVPVHLHGAPCKIREILAIAERHGLAVVEDCAQAHGASIDGRRVGSFGHAAAFSFYPTKNLGCLGDGGAVVTNLPEVAARLKRARQYGWDQNRISRHWGINSRLDEIHAAVLNRLLPDLDAHNDRRRSCAAIYRELLPTLLVKPPPGHDGAVYHQFAIEVDRREDVASRLKSLGIGTSIHYPVGLHHQPQFADETAQLPVTDHLADTLLSLPIQPEVIEGRLEQVAECLRESLR